MKKLALITGTSFPLHFISQLEQLGFQCINGTTAALELLGLKEHSTLRELTQSEIESLISEAHTYIYGGLEAATPEVLQKAKKLQHIAFLGTGWNDAGCVDESTAKSNNILVTNTPHANAHSVAEMSIGLMLALERQIPLMNSQTKTGRWLPIKRRDLMGKTLGVIGLGHIGSKVASIAKLGLNMRVIYTGPNRKSDWESKLGIDFATLDNLLRQSDFVSIHTPAHSTMGMLTPKLLECLKREVILINVSAPEVVDGEWLLSAIQTGRIRGAAIDGIYKQPVDLKSRYLALEDDRFIVLPRASWLTEDSYARMASMALTSISEFSQAGSITSYRVL